MAVSTVKLNGTTLMTVNDTTATASDVAQGKYYYGADGVKTQGTSQGGGGGGGGSIDDDVVFIDYDGTVLHSYSASDFQALTAMPSNPSHTGLTAQGWNWSLSDAKAQVTAMGRCIIGQMYTTSDGKTRLYLRFADSARLSPYLALCPNGTVTIDWGDGSTADTLTGTSLTTLKYAQHTYPGTGDYVMTLSLTSGTAFEFYGTSNVPGPLRVSTGTSTSVGTASYVYNNTIKKAEIGTGARIGQYSFRSCYSLSSINIPNTVTSIGTYAFHTCYNLQALVIPNTTTSVGSYSFYGCSNVALASVPKELTTMGTYAFSNCSTLALIPIHNWMTGISDYSYEYCSSAQILKIPTTVSTIGAGALRYCNSLASVTISSSITTLNSNVFGYDRALASLIIPSTVTSVAANAFNSCNGMKEYHFLSTSPPTLAATSAFTGIQSDCKIYVPYSADHSVLEAYQTETNWSTYASYMVEEPQ